MNLRFRGSKLVEVLGMPAARALDTAWGLNALSMNGSSASSMGRLRRSISSTMWNR